ncbi:MAG: hypothetical protein DRJ56_04165 [Thermoprotei archaeon]|nr:MAG: hypothetical protein DRJ56_04165 [Thermoprotei archaeon]
MDAKLSLEGVIMPVAEFERLYGDRVAALGGVGKLLRYPKDEPAKCVVGVLRECTQVAVAPQARTTP